MNTKRDKSYLPVRRLDNFSIKLKRYLKDDETIFRWSIVLKLLGISLIFFTILVTFLVTLLKMDIIFFEANGYGNYNFFQELFYDFLFNKFSNLIPYMVVFTIIIALAGFYIADLLMRPFRLIGEFCENKVKGKKASYDLEFFADLKLLTAFSEFFFNQLEVAEKRKFLEVIEIPEKYTKIHKPIFEKMFFVQYSFFIIITSIFVSVALYGMAIELHGSIIELAHKTLKESQITDHFMYKQSEVLLFIIIGVIISHFIFFIGFAFHLYSKVSAPSFALFATMRSFLKGRYSSRVHLIGHYYLRSHCRKFNKYLDICEKTLTKKEEDSNHCQ